MTSDRNDSVKADVFIPHVIPMIKAGKTAKEIAESLNMRESSFSVRLSNTRKDLFNATTVFKVVTGSGKNKSSRELTGEEIATEQGLSISEKDCRNYLKTLTVVREGVKIPAIQNSGGGGGGKALDYSALGAAAAALLSDDSDESGDSEETAESDAEVEAEAETDAE